MIVAFAVLVLLLSLLAWMGQLMSALAPGIAAKLGLTEPEEEVDPVFFADVRAECIWDSLSLWTLPLAAALLILGEPNWPLFGLVGGGMYVYFAGRCLAQRAAMQRRGIRIGKPPSVKAAYVLMTLWGAAGLVSILLAGHYILD